MNKNEMNARMVEFLDDVFSCADVDENDEKNEEVVEMNDGEETPLETLADEMKRAAGIDDELPFATSAEDEKMCQAMTRAVSSAYWIAVRKKIALAIEKELKRAENDLYHFSNRMGAAPIKDYELYKMLGPVLYDKYPPIILEDGMKGLIMNKGKKVGKYMERPLVLFEDGYLYELDDDIDFKYENGNNNKGENTMID